MVVVIVLVSAALRLAGFDWGLPQVTRSLTTYHPDEAMVFQSFSYMLDHSFHPGPGLFYGGFYFHAAAVVVKLASEAGMVVLGDRSFYATHLEELSRLYLAVRSLSLVSSLLALSLAFACGRMTGGVRSGFLAMLILAITPLDIACSHYAKPDAWMALWVWGALVCSTVGLSNGRTAWLVSAGVMCGLAAAAKYSAATSILLPLLSLALSSRASKWKGAAWTGLSAAAAFALAAPFTWLDWQGFHSLLNSNLQAARTLTYSEVGHPSGLWRFFWVYSAFGFGWPVMASIFLGLAVLFVRRRPIDLFLSVSTLLIYLVISRSNTRLTPYLMPVLPLFVITAAEGYRWLLESQRRVSQALAVLGLIMQAGYAVAFANYYRSPDTRVLAGRWIETHVPPGETIGLIRSYWWTPGILRQSTPPYRVVTPCDDQSSLETCILALDRMPPPPWLVTSEPEVREYLDRHPSASPPHRDSLWSYLRDYEPVAVFKKQPEVFGWPVWKRWPTLDFLYIAPTITIWSRDRALNSR